MPVSARAKAKKVLRNLRVRGKALIAKPFLSFIFLGNTIQPEDVQQLGQNRANSEWTCKLDPIHRVILNRLTLLGGTQSTLVLPRLRALIASLGWRPP